MNAPIIYRLSIERFRCIKTFTWHLTKDVNVILGGGDVGKTTILDAIAPLQPDAMLARAPRWPPYFRNARDAAK
jgi:predicted ATP-dependent endonuclease of OLD family